MAEISSLRAVQALAAVGLIYFSTRILSFIRMLASSLLLPGISTSNFGPKGSWAVVTGASDGIGREFALQLAKRGFNIVLVSRTKSKLEALSSELKSLPNPVETRILSMDFSANNDEDYSALRSIVENLDVSILVNNVGQSHSMPVPFVETPPQEMMDIITINCIGTLRVTKIILPGMVSRKRGLILSMASFGGVFPTPLLATYSGSKAFLQQWGTALGAELAPHGVLVEVVQSHLVTSAMSKIRRSSAMVPTPKQFVQATLSKIGRSGGSQGVAYTSTPWWMHGLYQWVISTFVGYTSYFTLARNKAMHEDIRRRALAKAARDSKKTK